MEKVWNFCQRCKPVLIMVVVQISAAGLNVFFKLGSGAGMSPIIITAYRYVIASAVLAPLAYFTERKLRPKMTWTLLFLTFICGLLGCSLSQILYVWSLDLTTATYSSAMTNLLPAVTFIIAVLFRLEKLALNTAAGSGKVLGTLIGISGAMVLTFYRGIELKFFQTNLDLLQKVHRGPSQNSMPQTHSKQNLLGAMLVLASCISQSLWLVVQAKMSQTYRCHFSNAALMNIMAALQGVIFAFSVERDWSNWKLGWNIRLLTVMYAGIAGAGQFLLITWCLSMRGPLFVSVFTPLLLVLVAVAGALMLGEKLYVGSIIGALLIIVGLYAVLWGKSKEVKKTTQTTALHNSEGLAAVPETVIHAVEDGIRNSREKIIVTTTILETPPKKVDNEGDGDKVGKEDTG